MPKTTKKRVPKKAEGAYTASINIFGTTYTSTAPSVKECLEALQARNVKGHGVLVVSHGEVKKDRILNSGQVFRLFSASRMMREIAIKQVSMMFDGI